MKPLLSSRECMKLREGLQCDLYFEGEGVGEGPGRGQVVAFRTIA